MIMYRIIGYYICEKTRVPEYLEINCEEMVSVSSCLVDIL